MCWKDTAGTIYGPFQAQEDGFLKAEEVVRAYRKRLKLNQAERAGTPRK